MEAWRAGKEEMRGGEFKPQLDPQELSPIYLRLLFCILLTTHCRSWAKNHHLSTKRRVFQSRNNLTRLQTEPTSHLQAPA